MYKVGIIGCGKIGQGYDLIDSKKINTHVKAFTVHKDFEICGICDIDQLKLNECSHKWKIKKKFTDVDELMKEKLDVISICSPTNLHYEHIKKIIKYKPLVIICEKPLSYNYKTAKEIVELCEKSNIGLFVNYIRRWADTTKEAIKLIDGKAVKIIGKYSKGLLHTGSHMIDFLNYLLKDEPSSKLIGQNFAYNNDNTPSFILKYNETDVIIEGFDYRNYEIFEIEIYTKDKIIKLSDFFETLEVFTEKKDSQGTFERNKLDIDMGNYFLNMLDNVIEYIKNGQKPLCSGRDALLTIKICEDIGGK